MLELKSRTGGRKVVVSGIGITYSRNADYDMQLRFDDGFEFTVRFKFGEHVPEALPTMRTTTDEKTRLITIECFNAEDAIGTGTTEPHELARWHGRKVSLNFWIRTPEDGGNREIRYCFYLDDEGQ